MVTHNEHDAKIAHRTIRLFDGQIVETENNKTFSVSVSSEGHPILLKRNVINRLVLASFCFSSSSILCVAILKRRSG